MVVNVATTRRRSHRSTATEVANDKSKRSGGRSKERFGTTGGPLATEPVEAIVAQTHFSDHAVGSA